MDEVVYQTAGATGRTSFDLLLTDLANTLADSVDRGGAPAPEGQGDGNNTPPPVGPPREELTGDPAAGQTVFTTNNCAGCHCADASGGCALSAPPIVGVASDTIDARLRGDVPHPLKIALSDQDLADLQAYLASLSGGGG